MKLNWLQAPRSSNDGDHIENNKGGVSPFLPPVQWQYDISSITAITSYSGFWVRADDGTWVAPVASSIEWDADNNFFILEYSKDISVGNLYAVGTSGVTITFSGGGTAA